MGAIFSKLFANIIGVDVALNLLMWGHSSIFSTEKYFDMTGAITYWTMIITGLLQRDGNVSSRQILNSALTMLWSGRLGSFLVSRIGADHIDVRFDYVFAGRGELFFESGLSHWRSFSFFYRVVGATIFVSRPTNKRTNDC